MAKIKIFGLIAIGSIVIASSIFYACKKETVRTSSSTEEMQSANNAIHKAVLGWVEYEEEVDYTTNPPSRRNKFTFHWCPDCELLGRTPWVDRIESTGYNGSGSGARSSLQKIVMELKNLDSESRLPFIESKADDFVILFKEALFGKIINGIYQIKSITECEYSDGLTFDYQIIFEDVDNKDDIIQIISFIYPTDYIESIIE